MSEPTSVTQINLSSVAFDLVAQSNYTLSIRNEKQQLFQQVISEMLQSDVPISGAMIASFESYMPIAGNIRLYVRLTSDQQLRLDEITASANRHSTRLWQRRETLVFLCFALTQKIS